MILNSSIVFVTAAIFLAFDTTRSAHLERVILEKCCGITLR